MKVCIVSSVGGHLAEVRFLKNCYERYDHFYVLNDQVELPIDMRSNSYFIRHSERDLKFFINLVEAYHIIKEQRPRVILSTGAGPVVPVALVGKFFGCKVVFVESFTRVNAPSLTGRIMYYLADHFFYQWPKLSKHFPKATFGGPVL